MPGTDHTSGSGELRVLIVDEHNAYRGACAALLRTEGLNVTEAVSHEDVVELAKVLGAHVVLIDAAIPAARLRETVRLLRSVPSAPTVVLMSSVRPEGLDGRVAELPFLAKADVCAQEILRALHRGTDEPVAETQSW